MKKIGHFVSPFDGKFGTPRQSGVVPGVVGEVHLDGEYRCPDALRGLEGFDYLWILWEFSLNRECPDDVFKATVRPPRLGGNSRLGVFATRSPFRPSPIGLSSVRIESIDFERCIIYVSGGDLVSGTPIYDIKPYIAYTDSHPDARGGFTAETQWHELEMSNPERAIELVGETLSESLLAALKADPRPRYQDDPTREYALSFGGKTVKFVVRDSVLTLL